MENHSSSTVLTTELYCRKSSESEDKQVMSLESQQKELTDFAGVHSIEIIITRQESKSAKESGTRPVFNELLADIRTGKCNSILCWAPDRLARNMGDAGAIVDLMDQGKLLEIITPTQRFTNNKNDKFLFIILCSQAKLENDGRTENILRGRRTQRENGLWGTTAPTGYRDAIEPGKRKGNGTKEIDPVVGPKVLRAFEIFAEGNTSVKDIMLFLRKNGVRANTNGREREISIMAVRRMLKNRFYIGKCCYSNGQVFDGKHEALIKDPLLFERVQRLLDTRGRKKINIARHKYIFRDIVFCFCGKKMYGFEKKGRIYYQCTNRGGLCGGSCVSEQIIIDRFDEALQRDIIPALRMIDISRCLGLGLEEDANAISAGIASKESKILSLQAERENCLTLKIKGEITRDQYTNQIERIDREEMELNEYFNNLNRMSKDRAQEILNTFEMFRNKCLDYKLGNLEQKKDFTKSVALKLVMDSKKLAYVGYKKPLSMITLPPGSSVDRAGDTFLNHDKELISSLSNMFSSIQILFS